MAVVGGRMSQKEGRMLDVGTAPVISQHCCIRGGGGGGGNEWLSGYSAGLVIERSRVRIPAGAAGEFSFLWSTFSADSYFGIRSTPVIPQQHVNDPEHSAKSAGGRLQLNTHAPYVYGFAWSDMVHGCLVYTERAEIAAVSCGTSHASAVSTQPCQRCKYTISVDI